jgi:hypothetical protein
LELTLLLRKMLLAYILRCACKLIYTSRCKAE